MRFLYRNGFILETCHTGVYLLYLIPYTCPASRFVMSLAVGMQGQKAYGLCTTPLCAVLVVQFFPNIYMDSLIISLPGNVIN